MVFDSVASHDVSFSVTPVRILGHMLHPHRKLLFLFALTDPLLQGDKLRKDSTIGVLVALGWVVYKQCNSLVCPRYFARTPMMNVLIEHQLSFYSAAPKGSGVLSSQVAGWPNPTSAVKSLFFHGSF